MALVAVVEALILVFHPHQCPPGWTQFDFDAPVGTASLIVTVPLLVVTLGSALAGVHVGGPNVGRILRRLGVSSLAVAVTLTTVSTGIAVALGWGVLSNLSSSASGCLTF
jgi:hypothetical protein